MMIVLFSYMACNFTSYPEFWSEKQKYPTIDLVEPNILEHRSGGQEVCLKGTQLRDVQTVIVGSRNATILESSETEVLVEIPPLIGGDEFIDITLVTKNGFVRKEEVLLITDFSSNWWQEERGSISIVSLQCPVEAYGSFESEYFPIFWCGLEMGYSYGSGIFGTSPQSGFAGELSGLTPLSSLPKLGESHYYSQQLPQQPSVRYDAFQIGDSISISSPRDFTEDFNNIQKRMDLFESNYYWSEYLTSIYPTIAIFDEEECYISQIDNPELFEDQILDIDDDAKVWMGFGAVEDYEGELYEYEGYTTSTNYTNNSLNTVGMTLDYSDYSGTFEAFGIAGMLGVEEFHRRATYDVTLTKMGEQQNIGQIHLGSSFELNWPDLIGGQEQISKEYGYLFEWTVDNSLSEVPSLVVVEFRIYDMDIQDPSGWFEVGRLVKGASYVDGFLEFSPDEILNLPLVPNEIDDEYEFVGLWGEITIAKHQFFSLPYEDEQLIIDFVDVIQSPVDLIE